MFLNEPVPIPEVPGKIVLRKKGENNYVLYEIGRRYDPERQFNVVERKMIGIQIPGQTELMLPNENYLIFFRNGEQDVTEEQEEMVRNYTTERDREQMLRGIFDQVYYEFLNQSRRTPEYPVSMEKVKRINRILKPLMEIMEGEDCAEFLELIPDGKEARGEVSTKREDGSSVSLLRHETEEPSPYFAEQANSEPLTCSDVAMLLTIFKTMVDRYFLRWM